MQKFWNLVLPEQDSGPAELFLEGEIASETWFGDEVTPKQFRDELAEADGRDVVVWINSPGGDVFAASVIYTALMEHRGSVTVKIEGIAASAASVIAMAGDTVCIAPTAFMMIHNPLSSAYGNAQDMRRNADILDEVAEGLALAYEIKTGLPRDTICQMMADETWMSAQTAIDQGFADRLLTRAEAVPMRHIGREQEAVSGQAANRGRVLYGQISACARTRRRIADAAQAQQENKPAAQPASQAERDAFIARIQAAKERIRTM